MKKIIILIFSLFVLSFNVNASNDVTIYIFHGDGCGYCANALSFLRPYDVENVDVKLVEYEVWHNSENKTLMNEVANILDTNVTGVPFIVIGETYLKGFGSGDNEKIKSIVNSYKSLDYVDVVKMYLDGELALEDNDVVEDFSGEDNDEVVDNGNTDWDEENNTSLFSFDLRKASIAFIIGAIVIVFILIILDRIQNKRTYEK